MLPTRSDIMLFSGSCKYKRCENIEVLTEKRSLLSAVTVEEDEKKPAGKWN
ncbi:MAG TPA: hypothetical protein VE089_07570 [Nitrososphaeraceae archaeon]|jgi:hypothetical protein|nr:hypothetical protein [Nitrososphaeraceae archaeon]